MTFDVGRDSVRCGAGFRYVWGKIPLQAGHDSGEVGFTRSRECVDPQLYSIREPSDEGLSRSIDHDELFPWTCAIAPPRLKFL